MTADDAHNLLAVLVSDKLSGTTKASHDWVFLCHCCAGRARASVAGRCGSEHAWNVNHPDTRCTRMARIALITSHDARMNGFSVDGA